MDFQSSRKVLARYINDKREIFSWVDIKEYLPYDTSYSVNNYGKELSDKEKEYIYVSLRDLQQLVLNEEYAIHCNLGIHYTEKRVFKALKEEYNTIKERVGNLENIHNRHKDNPPYQLVNCLTWFKELDEILDEIFNSDKMENPHKKDKENRGRVNIEAHDSSKINVTIGNNSPIHNDENTVIKQEGEEKGKTIWNNIIVGIISTVVGGIIVFLITKYWVL